ncbi:O-antigen ligase family protein [Caenimonas aquaedulcis]|uniref:O-antigen ligase family protein n=1 Tax=Caenimonas aquaedulcis TaxID=2793270 RepID=A0A931H1N7_9BURK|nr:O-antigen ligase family protein [Caenimonas aquaedulcis]MBG9386936.1 O-antigen ligase family protein [Caenimonas aquaedulcis]
MARKRKPRAEGPAPAVAAPPAAAPSQNLPPEAGAGIVAVFALMMFVAPAIGVPNEEMLQDTLKSIVVSIAVLGAALMFFWDLRRSGRPLRWHAVLWLPLLLMAYALGSMAWSHTFLGGVESIRWFIFSLLAWLGLNTLARDRLPTLAWGIHAGAVLTSLWAALQFWTEFSFFPQGPHPASTFVNRNFFAEFAVCTLPFSAMLLARARKSSVIALLAASTAFVITAILMTGTRSALIALWLQLGIVLPAIAWRSRGQLAMFQWNRGLRVLAAGLLVGTVAGLGSIPTGDPRIAEEGRGLTALERGFKRTGSISASDPSLGIRMVMWKATMNVIERRPLQGVGAGAWESEIPLYQAAGTQLETDYYVHNEFLQLLAEYGVAGWLFLIGLAAWLAVSAWRTWRAATPEERADAPWRAMFLCSLLALMIVSNVGFPWRMAATGALFSLCLAGIAASDARLGIAGRWSAMRMRWNPAMANPLIGSAIGCLALAAYITLHAAESERKIVSATKIALTISGSANPNDPRWNPKKEEMLALIRDGVALNPHYRKITPMVADELARWGDWKNAIWIWESVLSSRPNVVAILANVARGYLSIGQPDVAQRYFERAQRIQPNAPAVRSLEVVLLSRTGREAQALQRARESIGQGIVDFDLASAAFVLADRAGDYAFADRAMRLKIEGWPQSAVQGWLQLGDMYALRAKAPDKAVAAYREGLALIPPARREGVLQQMPADYAAKMRVPGAVPAAPRPQTSASSG